jgi:hypothetical protein
MKKITFLFCLLFFCLNSTYARDLCGASCDFTINFSNGGSIVAVEPLTFVFGAGGLLNLGAGGTINSAVQPSSTDFLEGGTLSLAVGESISFGVGGSIYLGEDGNLDFTSISIDTNDDFSITGNNTLTISNVTLTGGGSLTLTADDIVVSGSLIVDGNVTLIAYGTIVDLIDEFEGSCYSMSEGSVTVSIESDPITTLDSEICASTPDPIFIDAPGSVITLSEPLVINESDGATTLASVESVSTSANSTAGAFNLFWLLFSYATLYLLRFVRRSV